MLRQHGRRKPAMFKWREIRELEKPAGNYENLRPRSLHNGRERRLRFAQKHAR
jgi:hypothetical protein